MTYGHLKDLFITGFIDYDDFKFNVEIILDDLDTENEEEKERYDYIKDDFNETINEMF